MADKFRTERRTGQDGTQTRLDLIRSVRTQSSTTGTEREYAREEIPKRNAEAERNTRSQLGRAPVAEPFHGPLPFRQRIYRGRRDLDGHGLVVVDADGIDRRLRAQTPGGFQWGVVHAGADDLARAILTDFLGFEPSTTIRDAFALYVIARLDFYAFVLRPMELRAALRRIGRECGISCLRCLDRRIVDGEFACPVCRADDGAATLLRSEGL